jgi:ribosomal protein L11 methyltransferase
VSAGGDEWRADGGAGRVAGWQLVVDCRGLSADERDLIAGQLWSHPITGIEERVDELIAGFVSERAARVARRGLPTPSMVVAVTDDSYLDEWRRFACASTIGRFFVRPSWIAAEPPVGATEIVLDPQRAFGSGGHVSTRLALTLLQQRDVRDRTVLDVGCGSGVLAIAACLLGAARVLAIDIDPAAIEATRDNARRNAVADRIDARVAEVADLDAPVDLVVANVLPSVHRAIARPIARLTRVVIVAGLLEGQIDAVVAAYHARVHATLVEDGWAGLELRVEPDEL